MSVKMQNKLKKMKFLNQSRTELEYVEKLEGDKYTYEFKPRTKELKRHQSNEILLRSTRGSIRSQHI